MFNHWPNIFVQVQCLGLVFGSQWLVLCTLRSVIADLLLEPPSYESALMELLRVSEGSRQVIPLKASSKNTDLAFFF